MQIEQFLDLMHNHEVYEKKLKDLKEAQAQAEAIVSKVGAVKEIEAIRANVLAAQFKLAEETRQARELIEEERAAAKEAIQRKWDEVAEKQADLAKLEKALAEREAKYKADQAVLDKGLHDLKTKVATLEQMERSLKSKEAELNDKVAKLKALAG